MPIDALRTIPVEQTDKPYGKLVFRFTTSATLEGNALKAGTLHKLSLNATRYRKITRQRDSIKIVDICGHDDAEDGDSGIAGDGKGYDSCILGLARRCRNYLIPAGGSASIELSVAWRRKAGGDITSAMHLQVTPITAGVSGTPLTLITGDTEDLGVADPVFADFFKSLIGQIKNKTDVNGW